MKKEPEKQNSLADWSDSYDLYLKCSTLPLLSMEIRFLIFKILYTNTFQERTVELLL